MKLRKVWIFAPKSTPLNLWIPQECQLTMSNEIKAVPLKRRFLNRSQKIIMSIEQCLVWENRGWERTTESENVNDFLAFDYSKIVTYRVIIFQPWELICDQIWGAIVFPADILSVTYLRSRAWPYFFSCHLNCSLAPMRWIDQ